MSWGPRAWAAQPPTLSVEEAIERSCPLCNALPQQPCLTKSGAPSYLHMARRGKFRGTAYALLNVETPKEVEPLQEEVPKVTLKEVHIVDSRKAIEERARAPMTSSLSQPPGSPVDRIARLKRIREQMANERKAYRQRMDGLEASYRLLLMQIETDLADEKSEAESTTSGLVVSSEKTED